MNGKILDIKIHKLPQPRIGLRKIGESYLAEVKVLRTGSFEMVNEEGCKAVCTLTLVKDEGKTILVDTGNVGEEKCVREVLEKEALSPDRIDYLVLTHYHPDHVGNMNLFTNAVFIDAVETFKGSDFRFFEKEYSIGKHSKVIRTPGHYSNDDCTLLVNTEKGKVAIVGDLFWSGQKDLPPFIFDRKILRRTRDKILKMADFIVPGHGDIFRVTK